MLPARRSTPDPMHTVWVLVLVLCRTSLAGLGLVGLVVDALRTPASAHPVAAHALLVLLDGFATVAPLLRWRAVPLAAGVLVMLAHFAVSAVHHPAVWDPWYLAVAIVYLLLPSTRVPQQPAR